MKLLHIDSSILGDHSVSRVLTAAIVAKYRELSPGVEVTYRDLSAHPLGEYSSAIVGAAHMQPEQHSPELKTALEAGSKVLDEFMTSDVVVIGTPMYNFAIPSVLKEWVDRLCIAGKNLQVRSQWLSRRARWRPEDHHRLGPGRRLFARADGRLRPSGDLPQERLHLHRSDRHRGLPGRRGRRRSREEGGGDRGGQGGDRIAESRLIPKASGGVSPLSSDGVQSRPGG